MGGTATDRKQERGQQDPFLMVAGPGFEPKQASSSKFQHRLTLRNLYKSKERKVG